MRDNYCVRPLQPIIESADERKFANAFVETVGGQANLLSSGKHVATIFAGGAAKRAVFHGVDNANQVRHTKEFLRQAGFRADSLEQMQRDYGE